MIVGSLFSGVGGFDLGLEQAGHTVAWQCEADEWRRRVLAARFPGVECSPDVRAVACDEGVRSGVRGHDGRADARERGLEAQHGPDGVDLICGGFPCQDLSVAGRRAGLLGGERSSLFFECARVADELLRPGGWLLLENVPGLLSSNSGRDFAVLLATLADLGFHDLAWRVLDSRFFGVAQRRRRVFIFARRARGERARQVLLEPTSSSGDPAQGGGEGEDIAGTLGSLASGGFRTTDLDGHGAYVTAYHFRTRESGDCFEETEVNVTRASVGGSGGAKLAIAFHDVAGTLKSDKGRGWPVDAEMADKLVGVGIAENQRGELLETDYAHQLTSGGGKPGQGYAAARTLQGVRRLTPRECERLQGFPDDWTLIPGAPDSRRYAAMGDAVTVPVARWIGERLTQAADSRGAPDGRSVESASP